MYRYRKQLPHSTSIVGGLALLLFASALMAREKPITAQISDQISDRITVYATKSPQPNFGAPALISQFNTESIGNAQAGDISDLFQFIPGVEVENGARPSGQVISIRGFADEAIITLIDGRRQNFQSQHDGRFFIDPALLKSVEVVKGGASSIYGGGAIGGIVAFETKDADDLLQLDQNVGVLASYGYRSVSEQSRSMLAVFGRRGGLDLLAALSYIRSGDIALGDGNKLENKVRLASSLIKAGYQLGNHQWKFTSQIAQNDGMEPNNPAGFLTPDLLEKTHSDHQMSLAYGFDNPANLWLNLAARLYYNDTEVEEKDIVGVNAGRIQTRAIRTVGFTLDNQSYWTHSRSYQHIFSYGFEIYRDEQTGANNRGITNDSMSGGDERGGVPNANALNFGFYLQDEITWDSPVGELSVIPAVRFDHYQSEDKSSDQLGDHDAREFSPKIAASYKPVESLMLFASWSSAFRAPNLTERYPRGQHFPAQIPFPPANDFIPNAELKPEIVQTTEIGGGVDFSGLLFAQDRVTFKGSWFYSQGQDLITQDICLLPSQLCTISSGESPPMGPPSGGAPPSGTPPSGAPQTGQPPMGPPSLTGTTQFINIPKALLSGFEAEFIYAPHPFRLRLGLSYTEAEDEDTGRYLDNNVPLTLVAQLDYLIEVLDTTLSWRSRYAAANDKVLISDPEQRSNNLTTASYHVHDLYLRWRSSRPALAGLTLDLSVENILDENYQKRFTDLPEEGRSFNAKLSYRYQW